MGAASASVPLSAGQYVVHRRAAQRDLAVLQPSTFGQKPLAVLHIGETRARRGEHRRVVAIVSATAQRKPGFAAAASSSSECSCALSKVRAVGILVRLFRNRASNGHRAPLRAANRSERKTGDRQPLAVAPTGRKEPRAASCFRDRHGRVCRDPPSKVRALHSLPRLIGRTRLNVQSCTIHAQET